MMSSILQALLLAEACLYVCGAPTYVPGFTRMQDSSCEERCTTDRVAYTTESAPLEKERVTSFMLDVGAGGGTGPHGRPEGIGPVTQARNGVSATGRFGLSKAGRKETEREPEEEDVDLVKEDKPVGPTDGRQQVDTDMNTHTRTSGGFWASIAPQTDSSYSQTSKQGGTDATKSSAFDSGQDGYSEATLQSSPNTLLWSPKPVSLSPVPALLVTPRTSTQPSAWGHDRPTKSSPSFLLLPEIGPLNMMPRDDGLESLWTEATRPAGDTAVPLSQDEATEATMSSEALPLIFEPFEDATEEGPAGAVAAAVSQAPVGSPGAMATRLPPTSEADPDQLVNSDSDGPSREPPALLSEWTSPWQASGSELLEPVGAGTAASQRQVQTEQEEDPLGTGTVRTTSSEAGTSRQNTITTIASHQLLHKSRTGIEEMESEEDLDEEEDDENSEESVEEDSEEDLTEAPETSSTQPPYSLIPPPPVWVQRNQGLMRSWAELIREKAGYVSGMLAPVGIGITGALLIVGALYSIRMLHRKRRNSFKHQRRKARQPEQPREPGTSCQDQAMLLADSSEDEF
ncbi:armadillo-like helical domain-containing protein 4 isoform X2 [Gambusia affinis]|uniref:armadillo-like helical domain-containing protein 4 isoform X2 n=1 Tax=Gambusia affinis TaxID=33528 RepID=UPI001CDCC572|nr:armadillo-like helical domain-containing protein 4 isoform X2 [Gambusia affinis]